MKNQFDSGHDANVARFAEFVKRCKAFGPKYNPARAIIKLDYMESLLGQAVQSQNTLNNAHTAMTRSITTRKGAFHKLDELVTLSGNAAASSDIIPDTIEKINNQVNKYRSKRLTPLDESVPDPADETDAEEESRLNSVSQGSMNNKIKNFKKLLSMLKAEENYQPNEMELTVASLEIMLNEITTRNGLAQDAKIEFNTALEARDKILYDTKFGLITCVRVAKKYAKSAFGPSSREFKRLSKLVFTDKKQDE